MHCGACAFKYSREKKDQHSLRSLVGVKFAQNLFTQCGPCCANGNSECGVGASGGQGVKNREAPSQLGPGQKWWRQRRGGTSEIELCPLLCSSQLRVARSRSLEFERLYTLASWRNRGASWNAEKEESSRETMALRGIRICSCLP